MATAWHTHSLSSTRSPVTPYAHLPAASPVLKMLNTDQQGNGPEYLQLVRGTCGTRYSKTTCPHGLYRTTATSGLGVSFLFACFVSLLLLLFCREAVLTDRRVVKHRGFQPATEMPRGSKPTAKPTVRLGADLRAVLPVCS